MSRRMLVAGAAASAIFGARARANASTTAPALTSSPTVGYGTSVATLYTGSHSHWLQPWRDMVTTRTLDDIRNGIGLNCDPGYSSSLAMFAQAGFKHVRVSVFWSLASYEDPTTISLSDNAEIVAFIRAGQAAGLRPLVLVQAFDQSPCPFAVVETTASGTIDATDTTITLASSDGLAVDLSGLTAYFTSPTQTSLDYLSSTQVMCPGFITSIDGNQITLSKPVGITIPAGATLVFNTLLCKPWSQIGTDDYDTTMSGWTAHLGTVSRFMQAVLGTAGATDLGFDIEIWNETSFGSSFLDINNYYADPIVPEEYVNGIPAVIPDIVAQSSAYIAANPSLFAGVRVSDGFASVSPIQASSTEPASITALSKHPYPSPTSYPASDPGYGGLDANGNSTTFIPSYTIYTHEYFATAINPFTYARDLTTETNDFGGVAHGRDARTIDGAVAPVSVWFTEFGTASEGVTDPDDIATLTAKGTLRALFFNLGIGAERLYVYTGVGDTTASALVSASAPTTPTLVLKALEATLSFMQGTASLGEAGPLASHGYSMSIAYTGSPATLFSGNGTAACPDFVQPADYVLIPVQITPTRTAFVHWFTGIDMRSDMSPVGVEIVLTGMPAGQPTLSTLDPIGGLSIPIILAGQSGSTMTIVTGAADRPAIFVVDQT